MSRMREVRHISACDRLHETAIMSIFGKWMTLPLTGQSCDGQCLIMLMCVATRSDQDGVLAAGHAGLLRAPHLLRILPLRQVLLVPSQCQG